MEKTKTLAELMNMKGRVCVITGGAGHIGLEMADALAELGATIVLLDKDTDAQNKARSVMKRYDADTDTVLQSGK